MNNRSRFLWVPFCACLAVCVLTSCSTSRLITEGYPVKKGDVVVLQQPCHFIDNPGIDVLMPVGSRYADPHEKNSKGIVPTGTKVKFLGLYAESGYMVDTHFRTYGRIYDGEFKGRKISMDAVMEHQCDAANKALPLISRKVFADQYK
jgi:hypothetical protein